jgi:predicted aspartyl protease
LSAFVDTGADASLIPIRYIRRLSILAVGHKFLRSQWGERRSVKIYRVDIGIAGVRLPAIEVTADNRGDEVIVGRNILNLLRLRLDGPKQLIEITE